MADYSDQLEALIDRYGLGDVLHCLERICDAKAEHVAVNWQDASGAKIWASRAYALERVRYGLVY